VGRSVIYEVGERMAQDFPVFGSGPGTFSRLYPLYVTGAAPATIAKPIMIGWRLERDMAG